MDLPIFRITVASRALVSGIYVFTGSSAATITLPALNPATPDASDSRLMYFKNEGTANLTVTPYSGTIYLNGSVASIVLTPGQSAILVPENAYYAVIASHGLDPLQATTAGAPAYRVGGIYFDTTLNKLRIGGATAWETVTSA